MNEQEMYEMILNEDAEKYPLLNEIFAIRDNRHKVNNYTICVNGYISLDVINKAIKLQKENEELKEERQIVGIPVRNKRDGRIGIVLHQWESGSVSVLESINPRVINTHDSWNTLEIVTDEVKQTKTKCETIPVQRVKDKIEKIKQEKKKYGNCLLEMYEDELVNRDIKILQELIEKREEK